jgi:SNF2 family DNA or RNA helicase
MSSTVIKKKCPNCKKLAVQKSSLTVGGKIYITLECKHTIIKDALAPPDPDEIVSSDGRMLFDYQIKSVEFAERAGGNAIIAHEMGLGKTVIDLALLLRNKEQMLPALYIVKSGLRLQWLGEVFRWTGMAAQVIYTTKEKPYPGFPVVIVSIDMVRGLKWTEEEIARFKSVTIDECQLIKNSTSQRTMAIRKMFSKIPHRRGLSGTPIKNNAGEYFPILNFVNPEQFPSEAKFLRDDVVWDGVKSYGLKYPKMFENKTKDWIIRYLREDVLPDLPPIFRQFRKVEMEAGLSEAYKQVVKEFAQFYDSLDDEPDFGDGSNILGYFSKMRHLTGISKAQDAVDYAEEFLLSTNRKLTLFVHHKDVGQMIIRKLAQTLKDGGFDEPAEITSDMDVQTRQANVEKFRAPGCRILVASTLAAGEGLNLQFCSDCLIVERQWNPANEEQAEARFPRPGTLLKRSEGGTINAGYLIAINTIDEWLTSLVEKKRSIMQQTLDGKNIPYDQQSLMKELASILAQQGRNFLRR